MDGSDEIFVFHFNGSTHCLLFRSGVEVDIVLEPNNGSIYDSPPEYNLPLRSEIALIRTEGQMVRLSNCPSQRNGTC